MIKNNDFQPTKKGSYGDIASIAGIFCADLTIKQAAPQKQPSTAPSISTIHLDRPLRVDYCEIEMVVKVFASCTIINREDVIA